MAGEYSGTRLYLGNLPKDTRRQEVEEFFTEHGHGTITEIKLMDGFGFIQYDNENDAKDIVPTFHGKDFKGSQIIVQFARGTRHPNPRETFSSGPGSFPRPRRTPYRMEITGLPPETSWQDLKDFARKSNDNVVYSDMSRERDGRGTVEFETYDDLKRAVSFLDSTDYKGFKVTCVANVQDTDGGHHRGGGGYGGGHRGRSVSPRGNYRGRYSSPPPRYHSPGGRYPGGGGGGRRYDSPPHRYRERSPARGRDPYYGGGNPRDRSPPPRRPMPPADDFPPPRASGAGYGGGREDYLPPRGGYEDEAGYHGRHVNGSGRSSRYDEPSRRMPPSPPPVRGGRTPPMRGPPPRGGYTDDYDRRRY